LPIQEIQRSLQLLKIMLGMSRRWEEINHQLSLLSSKNHFHLFFIALKSVLINIKFQLITMRYTMKLK